MKRNRLISAFAVILGTGFGFALASCETTTPQPQSGHDHSTHDHLSEPSPPVASKPGTKIKPYPLDLCIVSDEDLDSMGGPITRVDQGQEIKFCCKACVKDFYEDPDKYLAKLR